MNRAVEETWKRYLKGELESSWDDFREKKVQETFQEAICFRVWLRSKPGMWALYDGFVDVVALNEEEAKMNAVKKLGRTSFPDRGHLSAWIIEKIEKK